MTSNPFRSPRFRAAVYAVAAALFALLGVHGIASESQTAAWLNLVATAVAVLALVNVPKGADHDE